MASWLVQDKFVEATEDTTVKTKFNDFSRILICNPGVENTLSALLDITKRILGNATDKKFQQLRLGNNLVRNKLIKPPGALGLLRTIGFTRKERIDDEEYIVYDAEEHGSGHLEQLNEWLHTLIEKFNNKEEMSNYKELRVRLPGSGKIVKALFRENESVQELHQFVSRYARIQDEFFLFYYGNDRCPGVNSGDGQVEKFADKDVTKSIAELELYKYTLMIGKQGSLSSSTLSERSLQLRLEKEEESRLKKQRADKLKRDRLKAQADREFAREQVLKEFEQDREDQKLKSDWSNSAHKLVGEEIQRLSISPLIEQPTQNKNEKHSPSQQE